MMNHGKMTAITLLISCLSLGGCSNLSTRQKNAATGAVIEGAAGRF